MKMNTYPKETLSGGINLGSVGSDLVGSHNPAKLINTDMLRSEFAFEVLNGCQFNCDGCYIPRRNNCTPNDIENAVVLSNTLKDIGISCEEMVIGPTDIFTATNFDDIMADSNMYKLTAMYSISVTSTLMGDIDEIKTRWDTIQKHLDAAPARDFDLFLAFDLQRYLNNDRQYIDEIHTRLQLFKYDTVTFVINFYTGMFTKSDLITTFTKIYNEFNVPIRLLPSFFRLQPTDTVEQKSEQFISSLYISLMGVDLPEFISFNMFDKYFGGDGFLNLSYNGGDIYITPFLFEAIPQTNSIFKIDSPYTPTAIADKTNSLVKQQYAYANQTAQCADCGLLSSCVGRYVLSYMESRSLIHCIVPKELVYDSDNYT